MYVCHLDYPNFNVRQMTKSFVFNDETKVNAHGFILLNAGIDLTRFNDNPVMLSQHNPEHVIGKWNNVRIEGSKLMADPVFDEADEGAKKLMGQVERDFLRGASPWIIPLEAELRDIPTMGYIPVVTKSELMEGSIVSVPSNALSLRLSLSDGKVLLSSADIKLAIDQITINKNQSEEMNKIILTAEAAAALAVTTEPEGPALSAAILKLSAEKKTAEDALRAHLSAEAKALVEGAITEGRLAADKKESFLKLAESDLAQAKDLLSAIPAKATLSTQVANKDQKGAEDRQGWDYLQWTKEDPKGLQKLAAEKPVEFAALKAAYKSKH
jgi:hypothetical protein